MVLYYSDLLYRYVQRRVCIATHGYIKVTGVVADVYEDTVRLIDTMISDEHDDQGWFARLRVDNDEDIGPTNPETLIHFHHITAITCLDDDVQDLPPPSADYLDRIPGESDVRVAPPTDSTESTIPEALELKLGVGLLSLVSRDETQLLSRITDVRQRVGESLGFRIPQVRIRDDIRLDQMHYEFHVGGCPVDSGTVFPAKLLALGEMHSGSDTESPLSSLGDVIRDPVYDLPAVWIDPNLREKAELTGCTIIDPAAIISVHLQELIRQHASELLDAEQVANAIEVLRFSSPHLVADVYPTRLGLGQVHQVLCQLLSDGVAIGWLERILERLSWQVAVDGSLAALVNAVRRGLGRSICAAFTDSDQTVRVHVLDPAIENQLIGDCSPALIDQVIQRLQIVCREDRLQSRATALLVSDAARWSIQEHVAAGLRRLTVIACGEVPRQLQVEAKPVVSDNIDPSVDKSLYKQLATPS